MEQKTEDRRKRKTKAAIKEQFIRLALEKDISKITVVEITKLADISRKTFYLNYLDIYDVLEDIEEEVIDTFFCLIESIEWATIKTDPYPLLAILSDELDKNPLFTRFLISSNSSNLISKMKIAFVNKILTECKKLNRQVPDFFEYSIIFICSGILDVFREWYNAGQTIPLKELCKNTAKLISQGTTNII